MKQVNMKQVIKYLFLFWFVTTICFSTGYFAWKTHRRYEASKNELIIKGKVEIFENYDPYDRVNPVIAVVDKGDEVKILDFYGGHDFAGMEVELTDGRKGYIHFYRPEKNYEIVKRED
jgi:hypothetical protein